MKITNIVNMKLKNIYMILILFVVQIVGIDAQSPGKIVIKNEPCSMIRFFAVPMQSWPFAIQEASREGSDQTIMDNEWIHFQGR